MRTVSSFVTVIPSCRSLFARRVPPHEAARVAPAPGECRNRPPMTAERPVVHHIPVCPFSQRLEILLALKGCPDAVRFEVVDITRPRDPALLALTRGRTALPVLV